MFDYESAWTQREAKIDYSNVRKLYNAQGRSFVRDVIYVG